LKELLMRRLFALVSAVLLIGTMAVPVQASEEQISFTKWFSPAFPNMVGFVDNGPVRSFTGQVLPSSVIPTPDNQFDLIEAEYSVTTDNPSTSFAALIAGAENVGTGSAVLTGFVTKGPLTGQPVLVRFTQHTTCAGAPATASPCFQGTIRVGGSAEGD
jgi:hypothetical protein